MTFLEAIKELSRRLSIDITDQSNLDNVKFKINQSYKEISTASLWEHLKRIGELRTIANYTTGQAVITVDSRTVTASGAASWTAAMAGRFFRPAGSDNWYKIIRSPDASTLVLQNAIIESSATVDYTIWKRFYYLASDVRIITDMNYWARDGDLPERSSTYLDDVAKDISDTDVPTKFSILGAEPFERTYSTGTASITAGSEILTGTSTSWLANVESGDIIEIGGRVFRVKRVESDTRIVMLNFADITSSGATYTIRSNTPIGIQFYRQPDKAYIIYYSYYKRVYDMVNDSDRPELSEDFDNAIMDGAEVALMREKRYPEWQAKLNEYVGRVIELKKNRFISKPKFRQFKPLITTREQY